MHMHAPIRRSLKLPAVLVVYTLTREVQMAVVVQKEATERAGARVVPRPDPEDGGRRRVVVRACVMGGDKRRHSSASVVTRQRPQIHLYSYRPSSLR